MKVKMGTLFNAPVVLQQLVVEPVHMRTNHNIDRMLDQFQHELEIANKSRLALYKKFGTEKDGKIEVEPEVKEFWEELKDFEQSEIEMPSVKPIKASELEAAGVKLSVVHKRLLAELFEYDLPEPDNNNPPK